MTKFIRFLLQRVGYDIVKYRPSFIPGGIDKSSLEKEFKWMQEYNFVSIIDIGANEGQFSDKIRMLFPKATIYAFEPLPSVFKKLQDNFIADKKYNAFNLGLGEKTEELEFYENEYSPSSSFLSAGDSLTDNFDHLSKTKKVTVRVDTLDNVFVGKNIEEPLLLKIDVQGFEDKVINGGINTVRKATMIICELSFVELYTEQPLFSDIYEKFKQMGFVYAGSIEQLRSPETNQVLQADGIFIRKNNL